MFNYHDQNTISQAARPLMARSIETYGFFPTLHALLANSPAAYKAYLETFSWFENETEFSALEQQVVFMTSNVFNECAYCIPGHTYLMKAQNMPDDVIEALRNDKPISDPKLEALRVFTKLLLQTRGHVGDEALQAFFVAGYTQHHALDILVGLASKLISNFTNAMSHNPPEPATLEYAWRKK